MNWEQNKRKPINMKIKSITHPLFHRLPKSNRNNTKQTTNISPTPTILIWCNPASHNRKNFTDIIQSLELVITNMLRLNFVQQKKIPLLLLGCCRIRGSNIIETLSMLQTIFPPPRLCYTPKLINGLLKSLWKKPLLEID